MTTRTDTTEAELIEKQFARRLSKAGWHTYRDEETGRVVTNAYPEELEKLEKISAISCEVVSPPLVDVACAKIGPRL